MIVHIQHLLYFDPSRLGRCNRLTAIDDHGIIHMLLFEAVGNEYKPDSALEFARDLVALGCAGFKPIEPIPPGLGVISTNLEIEVAG